MMHDINVDMSTAAGSRTTPSIFMGTSKLSDDDIEIAADIGIRVFQDGDKFRFIMFGKPITAVNACKEGSSSRTSREIFGLVQECRKQWKEVVVDWRQQSLDTFVFPFQKSWSFDPGMKQGATDPLATVMPQLAVAGADLYRRVFERNCDDELKELSKSLESLLRSARRNIAIISSALFLPWGMLYTHPVEDEFLAADGSNWKKEGFWAYQHIVWQSTDSAEPNYAISPDGAILSVNFDNRLSVEFGLPEIDDHLKAIAALAGDNCIERSKRTELRDALTNRRDTLERILYFYCHGHGAGSDGSFSLSKPYLIMSDGNICAEDLRDWASDKLPTTPLVFINACQGGQMTTMFYESFAAELLKLGAVGLIGAQIDIPAFFATEYGRRILVAFLAHDEARPRLGRIVTKVNRDLFDEHRNPLGFVYSLYRGANCFIDWETASRCGDAAS